MATTTEPAVAGRAATIRLAELYERHVGRAVALARLLTGDPHLAEDVAHEAFIRVVGRFAHLRNADAFDAYLRRTVVNLCHARFRRLRVERAWLRRQNVTDVGERPAFDPAERDLVWGAIQRLPFRQRGAVVLRYYEGLSVAETGAVLGCSTRAASSLLVRALASLRQSLEGEER